MASLIEDFLAQAMSEPQCAWSWHRLFQVLAETPNQAAWQPALHTLAATRFNEPRAEVLRLSFLRDVTGDERFTQAAADQVLAMAPANADRLAAYMAYPWLCALSMESSRADFVAALVGARLPELAAQLAACAEAVLPRQLQPRLPRSIKRIAVVAPALGNSAFPPGVLLARQCEVLARQGCQLHVFSGEELTPPEPALFRGSPARALVPAPDTQWWLKTLPAGTQLSISDVRFSLKQRWCDLLAAVAGFDPDAVLLVGLYSPLAAALYRVRPVVGLSSHTLAPLSPLDVWLSAEEQPAPAPAGWGVGFNTPFAHFHPYRIPRPSVPAALNRAALGLPEKSTVWLSVGARLESEIKGAWAEQMLGLLARQPEVSWLLVGGSGRLPPALNRAPAGRIRVLPARNDIGAILGLADVFVNPPRMGGGFSVAEAMAQGLPVVSFTDSDGGDKVGALAVPEPQAYLARLTALIHDPALRAEQGQALKARFDQRYDLAASGPSLMAAFERAAAQAQPRLIK